MYEFVTNRGDIRGDLTELIRCFIPDTRNIDCTINFTYVKGENVSFFVSVNDEKYFFAYPAYNSEDKIEYARNDIYANKHALYRALSAYFRRQLPWGSLTGIRPTRLASRLVKEGTRAVDVAAKMRDMFGVSSKKAELTAEIISVQTGHIGDRLSVAGGASPIDCGSLVNLYVHIPFCPTRCDYCSFVSEGIEKKKWLLSPYAQALIDEIRRTKEIIREQNKRVFSVYIGGGTPTVLPADVLYKVLEAASTEDVEFTCEAGRPDTIDTEKLQAMNECGVNRISINPQTLHDATLKKIGRAHTAEQFFAAYEAAKSFGFVKNVDLIAGLAGESADDFRYTLDNVAALAPENITVHTLCTKRGSANALSEKERNAYTEKMVDYSIAKLSGDGYSPYYLYRQKQMSGNLENIGWCKSGFLCVNNVTVMEEMLPVYACGAGAISKIIPPDGHIQRLANPKDVILYLEQFEERMHKKEIFYKNQFTMIS